MEKPKPKAGRPVHVVQYVEGKEAAQNFERAIKSIMSVPKQAILDAERAMNRPKKATR